MKRLLKLNLKRIISLFCIIVIMQSYCGIFNYLVLAAEEDDLIETSSEDIEKIDESDEEDSLESIDEADDEEESKDDEESLEKIEDEILDATSEEQVDKVDTHNPEIKVDISSTNENMYKGYMYANIVSDLKYDTNYDTILTLDMVDTKYIDQVVLTSTDKIAMDESELLLGDNMCYKKISISCEEFIDILGTDGYIRIYTGDGNYFGEINANSTKEEDCFVFQFNIDMSSIYFQVSSPIKDGSISITSEKALKGDMIYTRDQISLFRNINTYETISMVSGENVGMLESKYSIALEETESKMVMEVDNNIVSTEETTPITMNISLKTDEEKYDLFKNPIIEIEFPSDIKNVNVTGLNLLYKNGLSLGTWNIYKNKSNNNVLRIELLGSQSVYTPGSATEGTTVVMDLELSTNRLTSNGTDNIKLTYTNEATNRISYLLDGKDAQYLELNIVGKQEIITSLNAVNSLNGSNAIAYDGDVSNVLIEAESKAQTINITGTILNNFENEVKNVCIVGTIPTYYDQTEDEFKNTSNFSTTLLSTVSTIGMDTSIYYSVEQDPELDDESWTQDLSNLSEIKSYKIVINDDEFKLGDEISFSYSIEVPENIGYNAESYGDYTVFYDYDSQTLNSVQTLALASEEKELTTDDLPDDVVEEVDVENSYASSSGLSVGTQVSQCGNILTEDDTVYERQVLRYTVVITNNSNQTFYDIDIKANAVNSNLYTWEYADMDGIEEGYQVRHMIEFQNDEKEYEEFKIESIAPNESITFDYQVIVKDLNEIESDIVYGKILISSVNSNNYIDETEVNTIKNKIVDAELETRIENAYTESIDAEEFISTDAAVTMCSYIKNLTDKTLKDVKYYIYLSDGLIYDDVWSMYDDDIELEIEENLDGTTKLIFTISELKADEYREIYIGVDFDSFDKELESREIFIYSYGYINNTKYYSNDYIKTIYQGETSFEYEFSTDNTNEYVEDGDEINFYLTLKNVGLIEIDGISISDVSLSGLEVKDISLISGTEYMYDYLGFEDEIWCNLYIDANDEKTIKITVVVDEDLLEDEEYLIEFGLEIAYSFDEVYFTDVYSYKINRINDIESVDLDEESDEEYLDGDEEISSTSSQVDNYSSSSNSISNNSSTNNEDYYIDEEYEIEDNEDLLEDEYTGDFNISGLVWLDDNRDGIRNNENNISGITVKLYGTTSESGIDTTNLIDETVTDEDGYMFSGYGNGNYIIVFEYNTDLYGTSSYRVKNALSSENSDAISKTINGKVVAISDVITINGYDVNHIDLGLISLNVFDMSVKKEIESITVTNDNGVETFKYDSSDSIKLEINQKYYNSTELEIVYNIIVSNKGDISGYINRLVDYLPDDVSVNLDENDGWYYGEDGNLYNNDLMGREIETGKDISVKLVVNKSLANGEAVTLNNSGGVIEYTNSLNLKDENSKNDIDDVSLIISVSTGVLIRNVILVIIILIIVIAVIIVIKRNKKFYKE